ncbi:hypothetical protein [Flavobacterium sp.]|jgi:hypothetical protein|uniref:hypothetical protein n=1 Tax=Flavobacterium sp. TaxID=239 RepID=UPI0037C14918
MTESIPTSLAWYVQAVGEDVAYAEQSTIEATSLVMHFVGGDTNPYAVPQPVLDRAILEVGADLYYRKSTRNGIAQFDSIEPTPFRITRDPMASAYPILRPYLIGFA